MRRSRSAHADTNMHNLFVVDDHVFSRASLFLCCTLIIIVIAANASSRSCVLKAPRKLAATVLTDLLAGFHFVRWFRLEVQLRSGRTSRRRAAEAPSRSEVFGLFSRGRDKAHQSEIASPRCARIRRGRSRFPALAAECLFQAGLGVWWHLYRRHQLNRPTRCRESDCESTCDAASRAYWA